jgi:RHS repeat-associated protein
MWLTSRSFIQIVALSSIVLFSMLVPTIGVAQTTTGPDAVVYSQAANMLAFNLIENGCVESSASLPTIATSIPLGTGSVTLPVIHTGATSANNACAGNESAASMSLIEGPSFQSLRATLGDVAAGDAQSADADLGATVFVSAEATAPVPVRFHLDWNAPSASNTASTLLIIPFCSGPCNLNEVSLTLTGTGATDAVWMLPPSSSVALVLDTSASGPPAVSTTTYTGVFHLGVSASPADQADNLGDCPCQYPGLVGNPINAGTGNKVQTETDYVGGVSTGLRLDRVYNSQSIAAGIFGTNWRSTYERSLTPESGTTVLANRADGRVEMFTNASGTWTAKPDITDRLGQTASGWQLTAADDSVETYNAAGQLISITTRSGLVTSLGYNASGQLSSITGPFQSTLGLTYNAAGQVSEMTAPDGGTYQYSYDGNGNPVSVQYPDTSIKRYVYENVSLPNALTGIIDQNGSRFATFSYDSSGRAVSTQHAGGAELTTVTYNGDSSSQITDANENSYSYVFDTQFGTVKPGTLSGTPCTTCGGRSFTYDVNGFIASLTDWNGNVTTYTHDARGNELSRTEAVGTPQQRTITTTWHPTFHLPLTIAESNRVTSFSYDANGNLLSKTETGSIGVSRTWSYTYNSAGQVLTATGPRADLSQVTRYTYNSNGTLATTTDALRHVTQYTSYDANGRLLTSVDPNGLTTQFTYDPLGRLTSRNVGGLVTGYTYDPVGNLLRITRPDGSYLAMTYDPAHRLTQIANNFGASIQYTLDANGNRVKEQAFDASNNLAYTHSNQFNAMNLVAQSVGALGQTTGYQYDNNGNPTAITDPLGHVTQLAYDALNRTSSSTDPTGAVTAYGYDALNDLTSVTDARGLKTEYSYDGLQDQLSIASPDTGLTQLSYDSAGNVASKVDADGRLASSSYDALNRVTQVRYAGTGPTNFSYDQGTYGIGHRTSMSDASGSTSWTYDQQGRVTSRTQSVGSSTLTTHYTYDSAGRLASMTYPSGATVQYGYTTDLVTQISVNGIPVLSNVTYQAFHGPANAWTWGNGAAYQRAFDTDGRLAQYPLGSRSRQLGFDAASRITGYTDSVSSFSQNFTYDPADRLTGYTASAGGEQYGYDAVGNRTGLTSSFAGASSVAYTYSATSNQLASLATDGQTTTDTYDPTGNLVGDGTNHFTYDGRNRLIEVSNAQGLTYYAINGLGQRVAKLAGPIPDLAGDANRNGVLDAGDLRLIGLMITGATPVDLAGDCNHDGKITTADVACVQAKMANMRTNPQSYVSPTGTSFAYDEAGHLIGEYNATTATRQETVYLGDVPVAVITPGATFYVYADQLNAPRVIVNNANTPVWDWEGAPFGNSLPNPNPSGTGASLTYNLRFPGQYYDAESRLHYNVARDYNPAIGRYVESDPVGIQGGLNSYTYTAATPISKADPKGEQGNLLSASSVVEIPVVVVPSPPAASQAPLTLGDLNNMLNSVGDFGSTIDRELLFELLPYSLGLPVGVCAGVLESSPTAGPDIDEFPPQTIPQDLCKNNSGCAGPLPPGFSPVIPQPATYAPRAPGNS